MGCISLGTRGDRLKPNASGINLETDKFPSGVDVEFVGDVKGTAEKVMVEGNGLDAVAAAYAVVKGETFGPDAWEITPKKMSLLPSAYLKIHLKKKSAAK